MATKIYSFSFLGLQTQLVEVEADISNGMPSFHIVGLGDASVQESRERVRSSGIAADPFFGPWGGYGARGFRRGYAFGFYDPWLAGPEVRSYTVYTSDIDLKIDNASTGQRLFEGQAQAVSSSNRLQALVPNLVDAIFTDFPGNSGETLRITIREDGKTVKPTD